MSLVIIIPSYCPPEGLISFAQSLEHHTRAKVLVVNDGSPAQYSSIFDRLEEGGIRVHSLRKNMGKGEALKAGIRFALTAHPTMSRILFCDDDGQHCVEDVEKVVHRSTTERRAFVLGVRTFDGDTPWKSFIGNRFMSLLLQYFHGIQLEDSQSGLRCFNRETAQLLLAVDGKGFEFELRTILHLHRRGISPLVVPIRTIYFAANGMTRFKAIRDSWKVVSSSIQPGSLN